MAPAAAVSKSRRGAVNAQRLCGVRAGGCMSVTSLDDGDLLLHLLHYRGEFNKQPRL